MSDITERGPERGHPEDGRAGLGHPDQPQPELKNPGGTSSEDFDRDIDVPAVVKLTAGLVVVTIVSFVAMWFFFEGLAAYGERRDPEALPQPEAAERLLPPGPRLQATPELELDALRRLEEQQLTGYGLTDEAAGQARIPIERAMEIVAERAAARRPAGETAPVLGDEPVTPLGDPELVVEPELVAEPPAADVVGVGGSPPAAEHDGGHR